MIYRKTKPPMTHNRYEQEFEFMFVLSKGKPKTFNPTFIDSKNAGKKRTGTMRQDGDDLSNRNARGKVKEKKIKGNVWDIVCANGGTKDKFAYKHPAIFPEKLAEDHILSWSNEGDTVLDPMAGSFTTCKMAKKLGRNYIGIEISEEYCEIGRKRLSSQDKLLTDNKQKPMQDYTQKRLDEFDERYANAGIIGDRKFEEYLPYIFQDIKSFLAESIDQAIAEERDRVRGNLPEIRASALSLLLNDCPNCGQVINRSFVDDLTCRIQDEYKQRVLSSLDKLTDKEL